MFYEVPQYHHRIVLKDMSGGPCTSVEEHVHGYFSKPMRLLRIFIFLSC